MNTSTKSQEKMGTLGRLALAVAGSAVISCALAAAARADILELRDGRVIQGQFVGGSPLNIRFKVNGQEQVFATRDVLNIGFSDDSADSSNAPQPSQSSPPPPPDATAAAQEPPPAPAPPPAQAPPASADQAPPPQPSTAATQAITIPAGTSVFVRMIDGVDSSKNKIGDTFHGSLESPLVVGNTVVAPQGSDAYGKLTQAKEAGKISGAAQLTLELTGIRINGNIVPVDSTDYDVAGKGRGSQSAERIGGGAVLGTIIGAIAGGGKGAAIGGVVGAGAGTAVQISTKGDQVRIPSETLLEFKLQQDVTAPMPYPAP
ncbi:MAG TPA: hypothetical protein VHX36_04580 [Candidatus Acidoferrales bacterium]|jgi:hypothetical protein|nr:hypothetical protein [Candidatus Acidoferrales bacterium]